MSHAEHDALAAARAVSAAVERVAPDMSFGVVQVGDRQVAIAAHYLVEAVDWPGQMLDMPQAGKLMCGVFMLRASVVPVMALSRLVDVATADGAPSVRGKVAVVAHGGATLGIAVDEIGGVVQVSGAQLSEVGGGLFGQWIVAAGSRGQAIPVLDIPTLMALPDVTPAAGLRGARKGPHGERTVSQDRKRYTLARVGSTAIAFDFADVPDVSRRPEVKTFFAGSEALLGMVTWRGQELLLVDLAELLGFERSQSARAAGGSNGAPLILLVQTDESRIAVQVDELLGLVSLPADALVPLGRSATRQPDCYRGSIHAGVHGVALVLGADALMAHPLISAFLRTAPKTATVVESAVAAQGVVRCSYLIYQAGAHCATRLADVEEILAYPGQTTRIDDVGAGMLGLMVWRGKPLELFDLRQLLGRAASPAREQARVLVTRQDGRTRGFLVDRLVSLVTVHEPIAQPEAPARESHSGFGADRLLTTGKGPDALVCQRLDLKSLAAR